MSGVTANTSIVHEHRVNCEFFRLFHSVDQLNSPKLSCAELLVRRAIQIELAVERCPLSPDLGGLGMILADV